MTVYTHQAAAVKPPSLAEVAAWLWRWLLDFLVAIVSRPATGKHDRTALAARAESGMDDQWPDDLATMNNELAHTDQFPAVADVPPLTGWALDDTQAFTESDRLNADHTYAATYRLAHTDFADTLRRIHGWPDATEIALTAGARRIERTQ